MSDVFISYSRKDIAFAKLLHEALKENDIETWIDWQDIPPSADWLAEVYEAIEQSDTIVFIISETSLDSEVCGFEIAHAAKHNKRLIPIVIKDIEAGKVPKELAVLNWIFFDEIGDKFTNAVEELVTAISVDQGWVKSHTRFQNRALDWNRKEQDKGLLLRGSDLSDAESWLAKAAEKDPQPTALQTQFILKSRQEASRRQRVTLFAIGFGLVLSIVLGIFAWNQRNVAVSEGFARATAQAEAEEESIMRATQQAIAEEQRDIAEEQKIMAEARQLAASSLNLIKSDLALAHLLAIEGYRKEDNYLTRGSLLSALQEDSELLTQFHTNHWVRSMVFDPNGNFFVSAGDLVIHFWDPFTGLEVGEPLIGHDYFVDNIAINPDGSLLASTSMLDGSLKLWDINNRTLIAVLLNNGFENFTRNIVFSNDGSFLISSTVAGDIWTWDVETLEKNKLNSEERVFEYLDDLLLSPDNKTMITGSKSGVEFWDLDTEKTEKLGELLINDAIVIEIDQMELSADGKILATEDYDANIYFWDMETYQLISQTTSRDSIAYMTDLAFHPSGNLLFSVNRQTIDYWDVESGQYMGVFKNIVSGNDVNQLLISPDGNFILCGGNDGIIRLWTAFEDLKSSDPFSDFDGVGEGLTYSVDGKLLAAIGRINNDDIVIHVWETETLSLLNSISLGITLDSKYKMFNDFLIFHPDGYLIFADSMPDEIHFFDPINSTNLGSPISTGETIESMALSSDGKILAVSHNTSSESYIELWSLETRQLSGQILIDQRFPSVYSLAFSPDGKTLVSGHDSGLIVFWDLESKLQIGNPLPVGTDWTTSYLVFNKAGTVFASVNNREIILWDFETRYSIGTPMTGHTEGITQILFSEDDSILISVDRGATIRLWDVNTQQSIGLPIIGANARQLYADYEGYDSRSALRGHENEIQNMAISPDGTRLTTKDIDGKFRVWDLEFETWLQKACNRAGRNLSPNEWFLYFPNEDYRETCPQFSRTIYISTITNTLTPSTFITRIRTIDGKSEVFVAAGEFEMGMDESQAIYTDYVALHNVYLNDFWIDQTEVTNAQYAACVAADQCGQPSKNSSNTRSYYYEIAIYDNYPVINVIWEQANDYCEWVGGRLPTEAEWEKAARGTDSRDYPWGNTYPKSNLLNFSNLIGDTVEVGTYLAGISPYGALDMAGNVNEWVFDFFSTNYYNQLQYDNPIGPSTGEKHVIRGGSWISTQEIYTWMHSRALLDYFSNEIGFRCRTNP